MSIRQILVCAFALGVVIVADVAEARCKNAKDGDVPHGANELIQLTDQTVSSIRGEVSWPTGEPAKDIVVEIFIYTGGDSSEDMNKALAQKRVAACITGEDGKFSFPHVKRGKYLLRAGTRESRGINETCIILVVDPHSTKNTGAGLRIPLHVGT